MKNRRNQGMFAKKSSGRNGMKVERKTIDDFSHDKEGFLEKN